jgi:orotate phosphoribosyltransferase
MNSNETLIQFIAEHSYREGDFTLSSGAKSTFYIDLKPTLLHPVGAQAFGQCVVEWMKLRGFSFDAVAGLTLGADPMVMAVSLAAYSQGIEIPAAMIRKEPKKHGTSRYIEGVENLKKGGKILVLEDVVTTGASALKAIDILIDAGFKPTQVLAVVDRGAGGAEEFKKRGIDFHSLFTIRDISQQYQNK